jgi:hypothetical protein
MLLRCEGLALFVIATAAFSLTGLSWWLYAVLFFMPDASIAGYGAGPRIGAMVYNAAHSTVGPALLAGTGLLLDNPAFLGLAAVWAAHIGFDRMFGYGLKYTSGFGDTHLGRIGPARTGA